MCGIYGSFGSNDINLLKRSVKKLEHRGPDSEGFFIDDNVMLGVRRLSIIDLKTGNQPIFNEDKSIVVVFNGEIYTYKEMRVNLDTKGHRFYTNTDTEVIVHSYEEYGEECVNLFNGMFAFALWDSIKKILFVFRDRYGIKPVYYFRGKDIFLFSSEIKALLEYKEIKKDLNTRVLPYYLKYRYIKSPDTFIKNIKKVKAGHFLEITKEGINEKRYYTLTLKQENHLVKDITSSLNYLLEDSVKKRMSSEVPLGLFLSGGLDSTAVLHFMDKFKQDKIKTFTIGFEEDNNTNEFDNATKVSNYYNTEHYEIDISAEKAIKAIPKVIYYLEEPIADATTIPTYFLSKFASKHVKSVLSGEGADEVFRGYVYYDNMKYLKKIKQFPLLIQKRVSSIIKIMPEEVLNSFFKYPDGIGKEGKVRLLRLLSHNKSDSEIYDNLISLYTNDDSKKILLENYGFANNEKKKKYGTIYYEIFYKDMMTWLPDYILPRVDKMTMANSLECRVPFLDNKMVDYISKINITEAYNNKFLLRETMKKKLPSYILGKQKFPFYIPITHWFELGLKDYYQTVFDKSELVQDKIFKKEAIKDIMQDYKNSKLINSRKLWSLLTLELTYKRFILEEKN
jgi:asparagine synthase (glutamine-hydrolysing)